MFYLFLSKFSSISFIIFQKLLSFKSSLQGSSMAILTAHLPKAPWAENNGSRKQSSLQSLHLRFKYLDLCVWAYKWMNEWRVNERTNERMNKWVSKWVSQWMNWIFIYSIKLKDLEKPYHKWNAQQTCSIDKKLQERWKARKIIHVMDKI